MTSARGSASFRFLSPGRRLKAYCGTLEYDRAISEATSRASASPRQRIATLKVFSRDIFDSSRQSLRLLRGLAATEEQADAGQQQ